MHRTSTGPGINSYVPHADLNLRAQKKFKGDYFGPFVSPSVADYTLIALQKAFAPETVVVSDIL